MNHELYDLTRDVLPEAKPKKRNFHIVTEVTKMNKINIIKIYPAITLPLPSN